MSVALVLSGGASLGAIQVGMLRALAGHGVRPDVVVGTSVGAINGAFVASRDFTPEAVDELAALWLEVRRGHVFPIAPLTGMLAMAGARSHLVPVGRLRRLMLRHIRCDRLEDLPTPLHVVACDLRTGGEVCLSEGPLVDALLASAAIPGVFPPVAWGDRLLIDGGVIDNTPTSHALALGADEIYVLSTGGPCAATEPPRGALGMLLHATGLLIGRRFAGEAPALGRRPGVTILPSPCPVGVQPMDFGHAAELIARGEVTARAFLSERSADVVPIAAGRGRGRAPLAPAGELPSAS